MENKPEKRKLRPNIFVLIMDFDYYCFYIMMLLYAHLMNKLLHYNIIVGVIQSPNKRTSLHDVIHQS
jgi:hypothetical protein